MRGRRSYGRPRKTRKVGTGARIVDRTRSVSRPRVLVVPSISPVRAAGLLLLVLLALLGGTAGAGAQTTGPGVVEGTVRDEQGAPVVGAAVRVHTETFGPAGSGSFDRHATSDAEGRYRVDGIVLPTGHPLDDGRALRVEQDGYAVEGARGVLGRLGAFDGTPVRADVVLRRRDVVLRGRLSIRGGASIAGAGVTVTTATEPGTEAGAYDRWTADVDADGRYEVRVPAGRFRILAGSRYGLPTSWPDLAEARPAPTTRTAAHGETLDGLDVSMRARQEHAARDEFGRAHAGWGDGPGDDPGNGGAVGTYPRDTYRSVTSPNGPAVEIGPLRTSRIVFPDLPPDALVTVPGVGLPFDVPIRNTGDDVLWLGDVRVEGPSVLGSSSTDGVRACQGLFVMPGATLAVSITAITAAYAPEYRLTLVTSTNAGADVRTPMVQRTVSSPGAGPGDPHPFDALIPFLPPGARAGTLVATQGRPTARAATVGIGAVTVRRSSVRVAFPAAGRTDVRVDRRITARGRSAARWSRARSVRLRATRAGTRTARIRPLARGRYRIRAATRLGRGPVRRVTAVRTITR